MLGFVNLLGTTVLILHVQIIFCLDNHIITDNGISSFGGQDSITSQLNALADRLTAIDQRFNALDLRVTALAQRVTSLSERVNSLDNRVCNIQENNNQMTATTTETPSTTPTPGSEFHITRVTKKTYTDFYIVKLEYDASRKPMSVAIRLNWTEPIRIYYDYNFGEVHFAVPKDSLPPVIGSVYFLPSVQFIYPDIQFVAWLQLDNTTDSMEVPRVTLDAQHGSDVIFQRGSDAELDVTLKVEGDARSIESDRFRYDVIVKSEAEENRVDRMHVPAYDLPGDRYPVWLELVSEQGATGDRHKVYRINSSLPDPRGVLEVTSEVRFNCSENCLLRELHATTSLSFYSQGQSGPFPDGFLGFLHHQHDPEPSKVFCDVAEDSDPCGLYCTAYGSDPDVRVDLERTSPGGSVSRTDYLTLLRGSSASAYVMFSDVTFADSGDFRCTARSVSRQISRNISLAVVQTPRIDRNLSQFTQLDNGSVSATCIAEGRPAPNVTLYVTPSLSSYDQPRPEDYDVTVTQLDQSTTQADIIVTNAELASNMHGFKCEAKIDGIPDSPIYSYRFRDSFSMTVDDSNPWNVTFGHYDFN